MTVQELRDKLSKLDAKTDVIVLWEDGDKQHLLDVDEISLQRGVPSRRDGKKLFAFDAKGPAAYVFLGVSEG
jgi:hypothetical protein